jgi:hypothetical protein
MIDHFNVVGTKYYGPALEAVVSNISPVSHVWQVSDAELLHRYPDGRRIYEHYFQEVPAQLVPEPDNEYDKNAIAVYISGIKVGHVPADIARDNRNEILLNQHVTAKLSGGQYKDIGYGQVSMGSLPYFIDIRLNDENTDSPSLTRSYHSASKTVTRSNRGRKTWLWVLGWIFMFPVPLTIILLKKRQLQPWLRYGLIGLGWLIYLVIVIKL